MIEDVCPETARLWIRDTHQRRIDLLKCRRILNDIEAGTWDPIGTTGPVIVRDNKCLDGHHRLLAVLMYGEPIQIAVQYR